MKPGDISFQDRIITLFLERLHLEVPSVETDLFETGMMDSLTFVELLVHLEQEFGTTFPIENLEIENFRSIAKIAELATRYFGLKGVDEGQPSQTGRESSKEPN